MVAATPVAVIALLFAYIVGNHYLNYFIDASKLPPEARWLLEHMNDRQRIEDMVENAGKYRQLPCAEVRFLQDTYCFDRSRMGNMSLHPLICSLAVDRCCAALLLAQRQAETEPFQARGRVRRILFQPTAGIIRQV